MQFTYALLATALAVAGLSRVVETVHPPDQEKLDDAAILAAVDFMHTAEIESGQLAQEQGEAQEVKELDEASSRPTPKPGMMRATWPGRRG